MPHPGHCASASRAAMAGHSLPWARVTHTPAWRASDSCSLPRVLVPKSVYPWPLQEGHPSPGALGSHLK